MTTAAHDDFRRRTRNPDHPMHGVEPWVQHAVQLAEDGYARIKPLPDRIPPPTAESVYYFQKEDWLDEDILMFPELQDKDAMIWKEAGGKWQGELTNS